MTSTSIPSDSADPTGGRRVTASVAASDVPDIAADAALIEEARDRMRNAAAVNDRRSAWLAGGSFLTFAFGWIAIAPPVSVPLAMFGWCVAAYVIAASIEFEIGPGCALPTAPVQVVMLFT